MDLEKEILDLPKFEENWPTNPRWLIGFLLVSFVVPFVGGVLMGIADQKPSGQWIILAIVLLDLLIGVGLSGLFLAKSRMHIHSVLLGGIAIPQAFGMILILVNSGSFFRHLLSRSVLSNWSFDFPGFYSITHFISIVGLCSIYVPWLALSVQWHRRREGWAPYFLFALLYTVVMIWALFIAELFGPV